MAIHATSGTTVGGSVTTVTFSNWYHSITVINRGSEEMWARFDNVNPTLAGDECFLIPAQSSLGAINPQRPPEPAIGFTSNTIVKLFTTGNVNYSVQAGV